MAFALKWWPHLGGFSYIGWWHGTSPRTRLEARYVIGLVRHYNALLYDGGHRFRRDLDPEMVEHARQRAILEGADS